jgi:hypothetical protein
MAKMRKTLLPWPLCCILTWHSLFAQPVPTRLSIVVTQGEGAANRIYKSTAQDPAIKVEDQDGKIVEGAAVVFTLPAGGASGEFSKGSKTITVLTDLTGAATAYGLKANGVPGKFAIHVTASYRGQMAQSAITQFNMAPDGVKKGSSKLILILAVVGGAAAGGVFAATHKSGSSASSGPGSPASIILTPGSTGVGAPH